MKLLMHVLKRNNELKIDNETIGPAYMIMKITEEHNELIRAIMEYSQNESLKNLKEVIRETFDVIQVCILILWRCNIRANTLDEANLVQEINIEHKNKLADRKWIVETGIEIDVKE